MTAGKGIIHSEGPSDEFIRQGGKQELIQLWVNLPAANKMTEPRYQNLRKEQIPLAEVERGQVKVKVVAGEFEGT